MAAPQSPVTVRVAGRTLRLTNLDKVLYPATGFTKADVVDYYTQVAPALLPQLRGRPLTMRRWPDGVGAPSFYAKNAPTSTPPWLEVVTLPAPRSTLARSTIDYPIITDLAGLVWVANLAALELHVPQWRIDASGQPQPADRLVLDLDPGAPADVLSCARVAERLRERLHTDGHDPMVTTSGSKGLQVYTRWPGPGPGPGVSHPEPSDYARTLAVELERELPDLVVSRMTKSLRPGKVLLDWSQNHPAKTTIAPYSLRAREIPSVATPLHWSELADATRPEDLRFTPAETLARIERFGDLLGG